MSSLPSVHDQTTTAPSTSVNKAGEFASETSTGNIAQNDPDTIASASPHDELQGENAPTAPQQPRGSLSTTPGPFQNTTAENEGKKDVPITGSVGQQNAPGRAGSIGEAALGAFGYGGATVERPKEEQGLGEKIVNFLGA